MAELNTKEELFGVITTNETIEGNINPSGKIVASMIAPKGAKGDPGEDGITPTIGENGNWYLDEIDTGKPSRGLPGEKGETGETGSTGNGIESITLSSTSGKIKTYTILFTNGTTTTFNVSDGEDGSIGHEGKGLEFNWSGTQLGVRVEGATEYTYVDLKGSKGDTGADGQDGTDGRGIVSITRTSGTGDAGTTDTYTITYTDSTTSTFDVVNGANGTNGTNGTDGVSPTVTTSKSGKVTTITITDSQGTHTATILDGADGSGSGDMLKSTYDKNENGIVDNAEKVNNHTVNADVPSNAVFTDTTYTAGTGIDITNGVISNTQTSANWGNITGTLSNQTDLQNALNTKANTNDIPTKTSDLTNDSGFIDNTYHDSTKVDKVSGKGLSTNDYTTTEKNKLAGIESGAEVNDITDVKVNNESVVTNKIANIDLQPIEQSITTINNKISPQASSINKLADKAFVNSSVQTATTNFRGNWDNWSSVPTESNQYPSDYAGSTTPTVNDYLVIKDASDYDSIPIPDAYQKIDYIETSGTQYLDTGITPNQNTVIEMTFETDSMSNNDSFIFGSGYGGGNRAFELYPWSGMFEVNYGASTPYTTSALPNTLYSVKLGMGLFYINNILSYTFPEQTFETPYTLTLAALHRSSVYISPNHIKIYKFKSYDDGTLTRNMIPCYRLSDNKKGMYDAVTETFFENAGTGDFIQGPISGETESGEHSGTWRFKYSGLWDEDGKSGWRPEYQVNEMPLTAAQLAALNSGATEESISAISNKQDKLTNQTAYSNKGSATKVPKISTNSLGQVTNISEVTITQPTKTSDLTNDSGFITSTPLATTSVVGGLKVRFDSTTGTLYIRNDGSDA